MEITLNEDEVGVLKHFLLRNLQSEVMYAVYISPAQRLRDQADEIEQNERDLPLLEGILNKLNHQT